MLLSYFEIPSGFNVGKNPKQVPFQVRVVLHNAINMYTGTGSLHGGLPSSNHPKIPSTHCWDYKACHRQQILYSFKP